MKSNNVLPCSALVLGILIALAGIVFAFLYVSEAIFARLGESDQSLLFWYLPILFIGIAGTVLGAGIGIWGAIRLRKIRKQDIPPNN